jgi:AraC-like DNA-binding protein
MNENHCANATTNTAARAAVSRLAANDITFDETSGRCSQPTTVVFWPGPPLQAIYVGMGQSLTLHRHYATQISISLGAPLRMRTHASEPFAEQQSFVVGPDIPHQVEAAGVTCFVLWSEARALADLARRLRTTSASELPALPSDLLKGLLPVLLASGGQVPDEQAGQALVSHVLTTLIGSSLPNESPNDPRIASALSLVTPQFLIEQPQPITSLAAHVHLSPSRFRHLFRSEMGISVQSYLRWQRLFATLSTSARGASLTEAAHEAGWADSAHLTRVFRATFGVQPSHIFKNSHAVQVILGAQC